VKQQGRLTEAHGVIISVFVALAVGAYAVFLGQDKNWDLQNYHLYNPYALFNDRLAIDLAPAGLQSWFSPMLDSVYFIAINHLHPKLVAFLLGAIQGLNFLLIFKIASRVLEDQRHHTLYALFLALAGILTVGFQAEIGSTMHDSLTALFPLWSLWLVLVAIDSLGTANQQHVDKLMIAAGAIAGIGIALKLVTAIYALPLCVALLVLPVTWPRRIRFCLVFGFSTLLALFLVGGYWMWEMWTTFGNPLFPQFNHIFKGEMAPFEPIRDVRFLPKTFFDKIFYPVIFTFDPQRAAELKYQQYNWLAAYIAVLVLLLVRSIDFFRKQAGKRQWNLKRTYLLSFFCLGFLLWLNMFGIYRYLIVIEVLVPLLLFIIACYLVGSSKTPIVASILVAALTAVNLPGAPDWWHTGWSDQVYRAEPSELTESPEPAVVYLAGQPIAWIIPALDISSPFIQIVPNFPISEAYWERAKMLASGKPGRAYIVFQSSAEDMQERTEHGMMKVGITVIEDSCKQLVAYLGAERFEYTYCEISKTEPY
jgi:hypothetical protein